MSITKTPYGTFTARWSDPWGRRTSRTFKTKADARAHLRKVQGDMARGEYANPRKGRVTLDRWADDWLAGARNLSRGGRDTYRRDLDRHILPALGKVPVGKLSASDVDRYLTEAGRSLAPSTVHRHYRTLRRMLEVARERGLIAVNPCDKVQPPRVPRMELTVLDAGQVDALAAAISPRYRAWVYVMAYGGLRWSEAVGLRRRHVTRGLPPVASFPDLSQGRRAQRPGDTSSEQGDTLHTNHRGAGEDPEEPFSRFAAAPSGVTPTQRRPEHHTQIVVVEQLVHRGRGEWERTEPKAGSRRTITLPGFVAAELAEHLDRFSLPGPDGLVFPTRNGTSLQAGSFRSNVFGRALARAGLPHIRVHDLRHTAASLAIAAGGHSKAVQARMGHSSITMTMDRYGHLFDAADGEVAAQLDALREKTRRERLTIVKSG